MASNRRRRQLQKRLAQEMHERQTSSLPLDQALDAVRGTGPSISPHVPPGPEALPIHRGPERLSMHARQRNRVVRRDDLWALSGRGRTPVGFASPWETLTTAGRELRQLGGAGIRGVGRGIGGGLGWGARQLGRGAYGIGAAAFQPALGLAAGAFVGRAVTDSGVGATVGAGVGLGIAMGYGPAMAKGLWGGVKKLPGLYNSRAAWMGAGAMAGGMIAGPAGVIPGAILGSAGGKAVARSGLGALRGVAGFMGRNPRIGGVLVGAALAIPTLVQATHDLFSPTVKPPNFAFARPNAQYGMDPDNLNTQGLVLAAHYGR
jgi:hypothetical protein